MSINFNANKLRDHYEKDGIIWDANDIVSIQASGHKEYIGVLLGFEKCVDFVEYWQAWFLTKNTINGIIPKDAKPRPVNIKCLHKIAT